MAITSIAIIVLILGLAIISFVQGRTIYFKVLASVMYAGIVGLLFLILFTGLWNSSSDPFEGKHRETLNYKQLHLINKSNGFLTIIINYVKYDIVIKRDIPVIDSITLGNESFNNKSSFQIPIEIHDKKRFLKGFSLKVKDSLEKSINVMDEAQFFAKSSTLPENIKDKRAAELWILEFN